MQLQLESVSRSRRETGHANKILRPGLAIDESVDYGARRRPSKSLLSLLGYSVQAPTEQGWAANTTRRGNSVGNIEVEQFYEVDEAHAGV